MLIETLSLNAPLFFLIFVRIFAFLSVVPLISSSAVPRVVRIALALASAVVLFASTEPYHIPSTGLMYILLLLGEALLGIAGGFFVVILFAVFQLIGQYISLPMGFSASQVFDPVAQIEIPLVGQFLNLLAMLVFLMNEGLRQLFFSALVGSFNSIRAADIAARHEDIVQFLLRGVADLFLYSLILSFPFLAVLFLVSISLGLLAKAAPQMNLLILGFPISIGVSFAILFFFIPVLLMSFSSLLAWTMEALSGFFQQVEVS